MIVNFTIVLFDAIHNANTKPVNVVFVDTTYLTDGTQGFLENQFSLLLAEVKKNEPIKPGTPTYNQETDPELSNAYCMNSGGDNPVMTGAFLDYYGTSKLISDQRAWADFQVWFVSIAQVWMNKNALVPKVKSPPVLGSYLQKIVTNVTVTQAT